MYLSGGCNSCLDADPWTGERRQQPSGRSTTLTEIWCAKKSDWQVNRKEIFVCKLCAIKKNKELHVARNSLFFSVIPLGSLVIQLGSSEGTLGICVISMFKGFYALIRFILILNFSAVGHIEVMHYCRILSYPFCGKPDDLLQNRWELQHKCTKNIYNSKLYRIKKLDYSI